MEILRASLAFTRLASRRGIFWRKRCCLASRASVYIRLPASSAIMMGVAGEKCARIPQSSCSTSYRRIFRSRNSWLERELIFFSLCSSRSIDPIAIARAIKRITRQEAGIFSSHPAASRIQRLSRRFLAALARVDIFKRPTAEGPSRGRARCLLERREMRNDCLREDHGATARQGRLAIARTNALPREGASPPGRNA